MLGVIARIGRGQSFGKNLLPLTLPLRLRAVRRVLGGFWPPLIGLSTGAAGG